MVPQPVIWYKSPVLLSGTALWCHLYSRTSYGIRLGLDSSQNHIFALPFLLPPSRPYRFFSPAQKNCHLRLCFHGTSPKIPSQNNLDCQEDKIQQSLFLLTTNLSLKTLWNLKFKKGQKPMFLFHFIYSHVGISSVWNCFISLTCLLKYKDFKI